MGRMYEVVHVCTCTSNKLPICVHVQDKMGGRYERTLLHREMYRRSMRMSVYQVVADFPCTCVPSRGLYRCTT